MYKIAFFALLLMAASCHNNPSVESGPVDQHEGLSISHTLFSDHFEFYIEHEIFEVGEETDLLVHLTDLSSYKPCSTGELTLFMDGMSVASPQPSEPGIFILPLLPEKVGSFNAELIYRTMDYEDSVAVQIEVVPPHKENAEGAAQGHSEGGPSEIEFLKEQAWNSRFMVSEIRPGPFHSVIRTSGEIMSMPGEKKNMTAGSRGIVRFADPLLVQGSAVVRGQLLFTINSENMVDDNLELRYNEAKNRLQKSRSEYNRHLLLYRQEAVSERQYLASKSTYMEDSLRFYNLSSHMSEDGLNVMAPVSGTIHELNISDGEYTEPGRVLAILSTNRELMLRADLPQQYYVYLKDIRTAHFRPAYSDTVFTVEEMGGSLLAAGVSVAENDHYLPVIFKLENNGALLEGAFAEVYLIAGKREDLLAVPVTALSEEQGAYYVYVQSTGESYTKRPVSTGADDGLKVEITSGIQSGERVVTEGVMLVKAASMSTATIQDEHHH